MSWRTNPAIVVARKIGRRLGLNSLVGRVLSARGYEQRFGEAMLAAVRTGDVVWDIGANLGLYTKAFAQRAGTAGHVYAFEPSPINLRTLRETVADAPNVTVVGTALGNEDGVVCFEQGADALGATSRVVAGHAGGAIVEVPVARADDLVARGTAISPAVVKIDTEGFELDVLQGMSMTLAHPGLRTLCIEVHFGLLESRGMRDAPSRIEAMLACAGFAVSWPDVSHIVAVRA